jgi:putative transposase
MMLVRKPRGGNGTSNMEGFKILPRRWVVERTFGWLNRYRRLSKDYEAKPETTEALIKIAMIQLMLNRLEATC